MALEGKAAGAVLVGLGGAGAWMGGRALFEKINDDTLLQNENPIDVALRLWFHDGNELMVTALGIAGVVTGMIQLFVSKKSS